MLLLLLPLLAACAHHPPPPPPPPGMARLIVGPCADWGGDGKVVAAGTPLPLFEAQCCDGDNLEVTLRPGQVHDVTLGLFLHREPID
jgi:hypothetical protein